MDEFKNSKPVDAFHVDVLHIVGYYSLGKNIYLELSDNLVVKVSKSKLIEINKELNHLI